MIFSARKERAPAHRDEEKSVPIDTTNQSDDRQKRLYILIHQDSPGDFCLVGPFKSQSDRSDWGNSWDRWNREDPRWIEIDLPARNGEAFHALPIHTPDLFGKSSSSDHVLPQERRQYC
jgi:hypothetical protein